MDTLWTKKYLIIKNLKIENEVNNQSEYFIINKRLLI